MWRGYRFTDKLLVLFDVSLSGMMERTQAQIKDSQRYAGIRFQARLDRILTSREKGSMTKRLELRRLSWGKMSPM